jgi:hypothetical protein
VLCKKATTGAIPGAHSDGLFESINGQQTLLLGKVVPHTVVHLTSVLLNSIPDHLTF